MAALFKNDKSMQAFVFGSKDGVVINQGR